MTRALAILAAFLVIGALLAVLGYPPGAALLTLASGAIENWPTTLAKATPLIIVGLGIIVAFKANVFNIGAEGQIIAGALAATAFSLSIPGTPAIILIPATLLAGTIGGALWGLIPGLLKAKLDVNEILSTVMMNQVALLLLNFLLIGPLLDPAQLQAGSLIPQSAELPEQAWLPRLVPRTLLHLGFPIAIVLALATHHALSKTIPGYRLKVVGANPDAARYAGFPTRAYLAAALTISAAFAGLAGAAEVMGAQHRAFVGLSGGYGFAGIVAALAARLQPLMLIPAAILFAGLMVGGDRVQRVLQVPSALVLALEGLIIIFLVSTERNAA